MRFRQHICRIQEARPPLCLKGLNPARTISDPKQPTASAAERKGVTI